MVNNIENESFIPTGLEIILYNDQEVKNWAECPNKIIAAEPLSWWKPKEVVEGNASSRKRKRCTFTELEVEKEKEFNLVELYKSKNINEIILNKEGEMTLDPQELLKNLKGWTVEKRKRQEKNGNGKVDKIYRHPKSKKILRSLVEVKKFIEKNSYIRKASDNREGGSKDTQGAQSNIYLQLYQRLEKTIGNTTQQTFNNSSKIGSSSSWSEHEAISAPKISGCTSLKSHHDAMDLSLHSHGPSPCNVLGVGSSSINVTSLDEIRMMVRAQVEAQVQARVAQQVAERVSHYERTQREMVERMESMRRLLVLGGMLPPSQ